jgi:hypothetical protein
MHQLSYHKFVKVSGGFWGDIREINSKSAIFLQCNNWKSLDALRTFVLHQE